MKFKYIDILSKQAPQIAKRASLSATVGLTLAITAILPYNIYAQGSGTPSQLRVKVDANNYLILTGLAQTTPISQPNVFSNTRLRTDANGYLAVVLQGGVISGPIVAPVESSCATVAYTFLGRLTTGLNSHAANTWNLCGGGTLGLSGNTTTVTSSLPFIGQSDGTSTYAIYTKSTSDSVGGNTLLARFQTTDAHNRGFEFFTAKAGQSGEYSQINTLGNIPILFARGATGNFFISDNGITTATRSINLISTDTSFVSGISITNRNLPQSWGIGVANTNYQLYFKDDTAGSIRWAIDTSGNFITGTDNSYDFGASGATRPRTIFVGTSVVTPLTNSTSTYQINGVLHESATAPTIASGGCTSPAITHSNGTSAFLITIGSSCTAVKSVTLTMPAAAHFWAVDCNNNTSDAQQASNYVISRATSTTAIVLTSYDRVTGLTEDFTAADTYLCKASGE